MKNTFSKTVGLIIICGIGFTHCAELEEDPSIANLSTATINSVDAMEASVAGMYRALLDGARWTDYYLAAFGGDDITTHSASNKIAFRDADLRRQTPSSARLERAYEGPYSTIREANVVIDIKDNIQGDPEVIDRLIGEAHFLRAFSYFHLTRTFGEVPLTVSSTVDATLGRASFLEIYTQIENDLLEAERLLPDVYPGASVGVRPSKGTAKAYLAKLYLHWAGFPLNDNGKYAQSAAMAKEVVDNAGTYGYGLVDNLRDLWVESKRFDQQEGVFTLVFCGECDRNAGNRTIGRLGLPGDINSGWTEVFGEIRFFEDFEADAQAEGTTARFNDTYFLDTVVSSNGDTVDASNWRNFANEPHPLLRKAIGDFNETGASTNNNVSRYFMRYAEVLLIYAEASARASNATSEGFEALNQVRRRAAGVPSDTPDPSVDITSGDLAALAFEERKWELAGEFERWHDMVRMDIVAEVLAARSPDELVEGQPEISGKYLYFSPIPQSELDIAPQLIESE